MNIRQGKKKYIIALFGICILYQTRHYIQNSVLMCVYLNLKETKSTTGHIISIKRNDGESFEYTVKYNIGDQDLNLRELLSPDSLTMSFDSTVVVRYSTENNRIATIQGKGEQYGRLGMSILLIAMVIIMVAGIFSENMESRDYELRQGFFS